MMTLHTKFIDMAVPQRASWLAWADRHDWGQIAPARFHMDREGRLLMGVQAAAADDAGNWKIVPASHETPAELRAWAGY